MMRPGSRRKPRPVAALSVAALSIAALLGTALLLAPLCLRAAAEPLLAPPLLAAPEQQTGTPIGGGAQTGTQPMGAQGIQPAQSGTGAPQKAGAPIGGGAQTGTQPIGGQTATQTGTPGGQAGSTSGAATGNQAGTGLVEIQEPSRTTLTTDRNLLFPVGHDLQLGYGDLVSIRVYGEPEYTPNVRIGTDGKVLLPLIGIVDLQNLTITAAEEFIARRLRDAGMFKDPQVTLQLVEGPSAFVTVIGEAHGVIPVTGSRRLLDILASAGGLPATASHVITIDRPGQQPLVVDLGNDPLRSELANVPVFPGDTVVVARLGVVYIVGEFKTQGAIPLVSGAQLTLLQATALSGGPVFDAKYDDLRLIRTNGTQRTIVKLDINKVLYGKSPDPILQAGDIIFLPTSALKQAIQSGGVNAVLSLANLAITSIAITR